MENIKRITFNDFRKMQMAARQAAVHMKQKLKEYGFSDFTIDKLLSGKIASVSYGKVKLNKRLNRLITYYPDGKIKEEQI